MIGVMRRMPVPIINGEETTTHSGASMRYSLPVWPGQSLGTVQFQMPVSELPPPPSPSQPPPLPSSLLPPPFLWGGREKFLPQGLLELSPVLIEKISREE